MLVLDETMKEKLKSISTDLNEQSTALTSGFKEVEDLLIRLNLGVTAWATEPINDKGIIYKFGFCKIKNKWQLVCRKEDMSHDNNKNSYGLLKTISWMPRHIRVQAASRLDDLIQQIIAKASLFNGDIEKALSNIKDATDRISK